MSQTSEPHKSEPLHAQTARLTQGAAIASVIAALLLVGLKSWAQVQSGSTAVLASLADSALDVIASLVTLISVRYAATPPDADHRHGHGKAEALAGVFQAGIVAVSALLIGLASAQRLLAPQPLQAEGLAIGVMAISIVITGGLVLLQTWTVKQTGSIATKGDRAHYLSDFLANGAALLGIAASAVLAWHWADGVAGLFVAAWLAHGAWGIAKEAADHLLDREASDAVRAQVRALALQADGLMGVHDLRTRMSGPWLHIQFHADLDPKLSLLAAHTIVVDAEKRIRAAFPGADVIIHPDPKDNAEPHGHPAFGEGRQSL